MDRTAADKNYVAEATRRRRRILRAGSFFWKRMREDGFMSTLPLGKIAEKRMIFDRLFKEQDYFYYQAAAKANLSEAAFWILFGICDQDKAWTQSDLCREFYYSKQTVNSAVKRLEKMGFIRLEADKGNGNRKILVLTENGEAYCQAEIVPLIEAEQDAFASFTEEEVEVLLSLMQRQLEALKNRIYETGGKEGYAD